MSSPGKQPYLEAFDRSNGPSPVFSHLANFAFRAFAATHGGLTVAGDYNLPQDGPYIVAPNHIAAIDSAIVGNTVHHATGHFIHYMAKPEYWPETEEDAGLRKRARARFVELGGGFPIDRSVALSYQPEVLERIEWIMDEGEIICIHPQGTRVNPEEKVKIKDSVILLAMKYGVDIVPAGIAGTDKRDHMTIVYSKPLHVEKVDFDLEDRRALAELGPTRRDISRELTDKIQHAKDAAEIFRENNIRPRKIIRRSQRLNG